MVVKADPESLEKRGPTDNIEARTQGLGKTDLGPEDKI